MRRLICLLCGVLSVMASMRCPAATAHVQTRPAPTVRSVLALIVNRRNPVDSVSSGELRRIFLLQTQSWPHGRRITVVHRDPGQPERTLALRLICGMTESDYQRYLLQETFRGNTGPAARRHIRSADGMKAFVFNAPGAIGYVLLEELDDTIKVLRIDDRLPTDPEYRLIERGAPAHAPGQPHAAPEGAEDAGLWPSWSVP
jgi:ABC-type phosphate transport system substrate-binding protein